METEKKQNSKIVRLDSETMQFLSEQGKPFENVNDCVKRLVSKNKCNDDDAAPESSDGD